MKYLNYLSKCIIVLTIAHFSMPSVAQAQQWRLKNTITKSRPNEQQNLNRIEAKDYLYSNSNRGSTYNSYFVGYDSSISFAGIGGVVIDSIISRRYNADNTIATQYTYDVNGTTLEAIDSFTYSNGSVSSHYYFDLKSPFTSAMSLAKVSIYTYDVQGNLLQQSDSIRGQSLNVMIAKSVVQNTYDAQNNVTYREHSTLNNGTGVLEMVRKEYFTYNNGLLVEDSSATYVSSSSSWKPYIIHQYTYNTAGNLTELTSYYYLNLVKNFNGRTYYYYYSNGLLAGDSIQTVYPNNSKIGAQIHTYTYTSAGLLETDSLYGETTAIPNFFITHFIKYTYTSFGFYDEVRVTTRDLNGAIVGDRLKEYYYEQYNFPVGIIGTTSSSKDLLVYPVPTSNMLNICWDAKKTTQVQGRIVNNVGQAVQQWSDKVDGVYTKQILTHNLPNGMYYVILQADGMEMKKSFVITR